MKSSELALKLPLNRILKTLVAIFLLLFLVNALALIFRYATGHGSLFGLLELFYFDLEGNLPTYFSSFILLLSAVLLYVTYSSFNRNGSWGSTYWLVLSIIFFLLSPLNRLTLSMLILDYYG